MCGLCDAYDGPEDRWWRYGEYVSDPCPKCGRHRLMKCEERVGVSRIICEKCCWEPSRDDYCADALSDR